MKFSWFRPSAAPLETRLRDLCRFQGDETDPRLSQQLSSQPLSDEELASLALQRVVGIRPIPAARLEALGRRGFARPPATAPVAALRWSLVTLATVLVLNLAVAAALGGIERFGPRISRLLAPQSAAETAASSTSTSSPKAITHNKTAEAAADGNKPASIAQVGHILWVDRDPQQALAAFVAYVQHVPVPSNAVLASSQAQLPADFARHPDQTVDRAEQMRDADQCPEALQLFGQVLAARPDSVDLRERALYGHAQCLGQVGDSNAAKADLKRYLATYPQGRFASDARKALAE